MQRSMVYLEKRQRSCGILLKLVFIIAKWIRQALLECPHSHIQTLFKGIHRLDSQLALRHKMDVISKPLAHGFAYCGSRLML